MREALTYLAYAGGWRAVRLMPEPAAYALFDQIADQQWRTNSASVRQLEANLTRVLAPVTPEQLREVSRAGMRSYMRYWCDAFRLPGWDAARVDSFELRDNYLLGDAIHAGRGAIAALPHMGNWDHAGAWASAHLSPVHTVAEKLKPQRLYDSFLEYRQSLGMHIHGMGDPGVYGRLRGALQDGGLVALLADRDLTAAGIDVQFFGAKARFPAGPAALAVDTGAGLFPVRLHWAGHNAAEVLPEIFVPEAGDRSAKIRAMTQALADALSEGIRAHPSDWHMLQRLWLDDLDQERLARQDAGRQA
jgi:KDO2-lipid IV(A) lauroyltransferase